MGLIQRVLSGDKQAFEPLVRRYQRPLFQYLSRLGLEDAVVQELAQETFLRVFRHLHRYDPDRGASFSTWLFTIARRLALNELSRSRRKYNHVDCTTIKRASTESDNLPAEVLKEQHRVMLYEAMNQLPPDFRSAVSLSYLREMSIEQIAAIEGCAVGTVKSRIHRGKCRLQKLLVDVIGEYT
jgi:RNA polymerase sigma-70 factor (ECF subfamily)